ncbi:MAG: hypothetical protein D6796_16065 [Caldilineae bacterium]|nr:MAG: hypothetical protein D6796_16065 [Caldilineae bacterium]
MRKNPERTAWIVLFTAFGIFMTCAISLPLGVRTYLYNATTTFQTNLTSIRGTVLARQVDAEIPTPITRDSTQPLDEFTIVTTDDTSQAALTFFEGSEVTMYNNTILIIHLTRKPRFGISPHPAQVVIEVVKGRIRVRVGSANTDRRFEVKTPHAHVSLQNGSYAVEASNEKTFVTTRAGLAEVTAQGAMVAVAQGELTTVAVNEPPTPPAPAEQNLLVNGDFSQGLSDSWHPTVYVPAETITDTVQVVERNEEGLVSKADLLNAVTSTLRIVTIGGQPVLEFSSEGADNVHTEASIRQDINKDVQDFQSLRINAQIRLNYQSLPGGGQLGTEFPVMIQLAYRDADGNDRNWFHGFYYQSPPNNYILYNQPDNSNESITQFLWYPYESENLLVSLGNARPVYVKYIRIYASGWIYNSMVTDVKLLAKD